MSIQLSYRASMVAAAAVAAALWVQIASHDGLFGEVFLLAFGEDTAYSPGYSYETLRSIRIGDAEGRVITALGKPLEILETMDGTGRILFYSRSPSSTHCRLRAVHVADGAVKEVISEVYVD